MGLEEMDSDRDPGTIKARVHYKYKYTHSVWRQTSWRTADDSGGCFFPISGSHFRVEVRGDDFRDINIDNIKVLFQLEDRRFTRGISANQINT